MKNIIPTENQEQRALVKWMDLHPLIKDFYFKIPNDGKRTEIQGYHLRLTGLKQGVPDLFIYYPTSTYHGLFLEMKRVMNYPPSARKSVTWKAQEEFIERARSRQYCARFCYGWEEGKRIIEEYLKT